jgi:arginine decarboxylase-like protein
MSSSSSKTSNELGKVIEKTRVNRDPSNAWLRVRLYSRGSGRWEKSGGEQSSSD